MAFRRGTGTARDRSESPPQLRVRLPRRRPPPRRPRAQLIDAPRPDTPAGCRNSAPSPRSVTSSCASPKGGAALAEQLGQLCPEHLRHGSPLSWHGPLPGLDLHARLTSASSDWTRQSASNVALPAGVHRCPGSPPRPPRRRHGLQSPSGLPPSVPIPLPVPRPSTEPFSPPPWTLDSP